MREATSAPDPALPDQRAAMATYALSRRLLAQGLGLVFFFAFASLAGQMRGLFGAHGIAPVAELLPAAREQLGSGAYWQLPTIFWLGASDASLVGTCYAGMGLSAVLAAGFCPGLCVMLLWALFLSLNAIGSPFLNFQWDALLLETALPAALFLPWRWRPRWAVVTRISVLGRWLLVWLIFRLMFESGVVKLSSGDPTWRHLTAMTFHYETQPLPLWTAWYADHAPLWMHELEVLGTFAIEFGAPLLILGPRRCRHVGALAIVALQAAIAATGNYAYFNFLTALLCLPLLSDAFWPVRWVGKWVGETVKTSRRIPPALWLLGPLAAAAVVVTGLELVGTFQTNFVPPESLASLERFVEPLRSFNAYGLFAVMTTERLEIEVEGSVDGQIWEPYRFPWKPGEVNRRPRLVAPFQPRLDWQMWFAALGSYRQNPWFIRFLERLLEGSPEVLGLLEWNPFPGHPPKYVRSVAYQYHFTAYGEGRAWWKREEKGLYTPPLSLRTETDGTRP